MQDERNTQPEGVLVELRPIDRERIRIRNLLGRIEQDEIERALMTLDKHGIKYQLHNCTRRDKDST